MRRFIPFSLAVVLAGCSTAGSTTTSASPAPETTPAVTETTEAPSPPPETTAAGGGQTIIAISEFSFAPPTLALQVGDTVTWRNDGTLPHTSTSSDNWNSGAITPGSSFTQTFEAPGTFGYICNFHPNRMAGTITVEG
ncbi:MAG TPA: cupredoxin domain-containing protein [Acidimicrobiia bacterium]